MHNYHCWCYITIVLLWVVHYYKMDISLLFMWTCNLYCSETWLLKLLCKLRKNEKLKRMYQFERRVMPVTDTTFWGMYRAPVMDTIVEGHVVCCDKWTNIYVPHGFKIERQRFCIIRFDMHHFNWHFILLHSTYLSFVNFILCLSYLVSAFLWKLIDKYWVCY